MHIKNAWYVAASPVEIDPKPLGRMICGERMVFHRGQQGQAVALEDWCPHRGAPLSLGRVVDGQLVCGYHGLTMGCDGRTVAMPGQRVRGFAPIRAFPVIERHGFIWVWPGDAGQADASLIPDLTWASDPEWRFGGGMYHVACDHRLMIDNLMDLTHETYVHQGSIGQPEIDETPCKTTVDGDTATTARFMDGIQAPPFWRMAMRAHGLDDSQPVDRWQVCHYSPPSHVMIEVGVALAGRGGRAAPREARTSAIVVDFITPETETSIWYFWGMARNFRPDDEALTTQIREGQRKIFGEDLEMLERQQANLLKWPERELLRLNIDAGGVHARKVIARHVAEERAAAAALAGAASQTGGA
ncbi:aromatic ring-hydroxylating oxygenase subunit alpha [Sphaerotilus mobilis]|uniref:Vanillate O-demethylase monooxygenase subunit n=1 Tax=Sphaerotilus mobilis TaxID=47994 RepID=A0A4Q7LSV6_9BURK|nr:aromatic ring-hydroxylating dioxygenase subunit alpha [Sphaerotilus mobilis]RZS57078.1 vanillate O-demethylase monooxygenase subunit [Sphaerotilus mobilis]